RHRAVHDAVADRPHEVGAGGLGGIGGGELEDALAVVPGAGPEEIGRRAVAVAGDAVAVQAMLSIQGVAAGLVDDRAGFGILVLERLLPAVVARDNVIGQVPAAVG